MNHALISLAANDEKKETTIAHALRLIESYCVILNQTPEYRSEAAGESQQPCYANALLQVETDQEYEELRRRFKSLELLAKDYSHYYYIRLIHLYSLQAMFSPLLAPALLIHM